MPKRPQIKKEHTFEQRMERLEEIVQMIERGEIPLDEVMKLYEEGVNLSRQCLDQLRQTEIKLKTLGKDLTGAFTTAEDAGNE
jgi:exodeoxyribonuclease VII small subunit